MASAPPTIATRTDGHYSNVLQVNGSPLSVRRAGVGDHDGILAMDASAGAYDGGDYLHSTLKLYLEDPNRVAYIAVLEGKIVSWGYLP